MTPNSGLLAFSSPEADRKAKCSQCFLVSRVYRIQYIATTLRFVSAKLTSLIGHNVYLIGYYCENTATEQSSVIPVHQKIRGLKQLTNYVCASFL